ncbi:hypothetical protein ASPWEDRAFT_43406 [Aspergillus wentii DTO 134E9]|uniref:Mid2 domain-containing protein n=1 Tax=Aspergillus wentii DTO 134E9 TaxID=1073089 RepID=A0A1L9REI5_ASPWE|nr:uncharacterized protein ASPWEDRAFT_43406 [Aspergillus wentii DTO 134E9]OJJ33332.1 hypothetical protein ASPWEDRAFT_43406 [Aspergillus wentii DTO 134E9]
MKKLSILFVFLSLALLGLSHPYAAATPAQPAARTADLPAPTAAPELINSDDQKPWIIQKRDSSDTTTESESSTSTTDSTTSETSTSTSETSTSDTTTSDTSTTSSTTSTTSTSSTSTTTSSSSSTTSSSSSSTTSSTSTTSSSSTTTSSSATATSTTIAAEAERDHKGTIAAIATFSSLGFIFVVGCLAAYWRKKVKERRIAEQQELLQAGSSAYSMVPLSEGAGKSTSEVKLDRMSMMFATEPRPEEQLAFRASNPMLDQYHQQQQYGDGVGYGRPLSGPPQLYDQHAPLAASQEDYRPSSSRV